jgi:hypothetical protein
VTLDQALLSIIVGDPSLIICNSLDEIFSMSPIDLSVKELCVGISILSKTGRKQLTFVTCYMEMPYHAVILAG